MKTAFALTGLGLMLMIAGQVLGLWFTPPEATMGETGRILHVHVPTAQVAMMLYLVAFIAAIGGLWTGRYGWDALLESTVEVGVVLNALLLVQGAIWAKPTWGVFWTWDPRLTTSAVMMVMFGVVLLLRRVVEVPERRLSLSAIATIAAFVDVPIVYLSVKWWRTLHQGMSGGGTISDAMRLPLRIASVGMLIFAIGLVIFRYRIARSQLAREADAPELPDIPEPLRLGGDAPTADGLSQSSSEVS